MKAPLLGIHHVTAIAGDPQANVDFYTQVLGQRLVKLTVNFDDPTTYHLYYGDEAGTPGSIMTFFPWPGVPQGRIGPGQPTATAYAIARGSAGSWLERLRASGVDAQPSERLGMAGVALRDPDRLQLELVETEGAGDSPARFAGITVTVADAAPTREVLERDLGFEPVAAEAGTIRFRAGESHVDLVEDATAPHGLQSVGTVHHVAFRTGSDADQLAWREALIAAGHDVTPVRDRNYFHSIYFREPGGVLIEIATDPPGFATDEPAGRLGSSLRLPEWLEPRRAELEAVLPRLDVRAPSTP